MPIDGGLSTRSLRENIVKEPADNKPACFIRTEDFDNLKMGDLWDAIALTDEEPKVIQALKIIEPKIDRIAFLSRFDNMSGVFVRLEDLNDRVPLGSLGDGVRHLLIISLAVIRSIGGAVMIDEIDTGLHHTVMTDMWRMLIKTAKRLNVQVFATTHSLDCVRSLAWLHEQEPDICQGVRLHRVDIEYDKTTVYSPQEIALAAKHHAEIRG